MEIPVQILQQALKTHPAMQQFNQMMAGKNIEQQMQTLLNFARSSGLDPNAKIFSADYLRSIGVPIPPPNQG